MCSNDHEKENREMYVEISTRRLNTFTRKLRTNNAPDVDKIISLTRPIPKEINIQSENTTNNKEVKKD